MIDYDEASKTYNHSRDTDDKIINLFYQKVGLNEVTKILDFGCGTGNYLSKISNIYHCICYGIDPSEGMRAIAQKNNPTAYIKKGDHTHIPFKDRLFDFIYMTDVIHHIPDISTLFRTLQKKLKELGLICIVTESWQQIETHWYNEYFPSLCENEKKRYPDIHQIIEAAKQRKLTLEDVEINPSTEIKMIDQDFIQLVEEKNYSMFRLLDETEYSKGLLKLKEDIGKTVGKKGSGETLLWLRK